MTSGRLEADHVAMFLDELCEWSHEFFLENYGKADTLYQDHDASRLAVD